MTNPGYTPGSVERALDTHQANGLIKSWSRVYPERGTGYRREVNLTSGDTIDLRSLREAYVFVLGLASAAQAQAKQLALVHELAGNYQRNLLGAVSAMDAIAAVLL